ncbi:cytochrome oxidase small assembly protein [Variovorax sp. DXTD-1]|nr:cytochrome oxidase small assembly protein [Variovorax sp. DXTD-1]
MTTPEQRKSNRRMGLTLASIAVMFFLGFLVRMIWFSGR